MLLAGCAQPEGPVGSGVGGGPSGTLRSVVCGVLADTSFKTSGFTTGGSSHLYVGSSNGIASEAIARFNRPVRPFEWTVTSARFEVAWQGGIGVATNPAVEGRLTVFEWTESKQPSRAEIPAGTALTASGDMSPDTGWINFDVPPSEITSWFNWVDSSASDTNWSDPNRPDSALTLHLKAPLAADKIIRFRSRSASGDSLKPWLWIFVTVRDSAGGSLHPDTLKLLAAGDLFIAEDSNVLPGGRLSLGGGAAIRSALQFDLSAIWNRHPTSRIVVNRAVLTLTKDHSLYTWSPRTRSVWPYQMTDRTWMTDPDSARITGFVLLPTPIDSTLDTLQIGVTPPAVEWAKGEADNHGLLLETAGEGLDLDRIAFYSSEESDSAKRPRLTVYFTEFPR